MNKDLLKDKLKNIYNIKLFKKDFIQSIYSAIIKSDQWDLLRINPYLFAETNDIPNDEAIDFFIIASRYGLFDLNWSFVCPLCASITHSGNHINSIKSDHFFCMVCDRTFFNNMDDYVEVSFKINPDIVNFTEDIYKDNINYYRFHISTSYKPTEEFMKYVQKVHISFNPIEPEETIEIAHTFKEERLYRFLNLSINDRIYIYTNSTISEKPTELSIEINDNGFSQKEFHIEAGRVILKVKNNLLNKTAFDFLEADIPQINKLIDENKTMLPLERLTGKDLINRQVFREYYSFKNIDPDLHINIRSLTILFTDLKDSTLIYDTDGDIAAYRMIQDHFKILADVVKRYSGALIKTMGDAIMATFSHPDEGIEASIEMIETINKIEYKNNKLGLKIGLHEGPALVINNEGKLDYFGQTVNIAARVQGLAEAGEICITESLHNILKEETVNKIKQLEKENYTTVLKGVGKEARIYKYNL